MSSIYCNSSGSTLSAYSVTYGQSGFSTTGRPLSQARTVDISTTYKKFSTTIDWIPVVNGPFQLGAIVGVRQNYTLSNGWSNGWSFNIVG